MSPSVPEIQGIYATGGGGGHPFRVEFKPVLNWANVNLFAEHTSDSSTNYDSFLN